MKLFQRAKHAVSTCILTFKMVRMWDRAADLAAEGRYAEGAALMQRVEDLVGFEKLPASFLLLRGTLEYGRKRYRDAMQFLVESHLRFQQEQVSAGQESETRTNERNYMMTYAATLGMKIFNEQHFTGYHGLTADFSSFVIEKVPIGTRKIFPFGSE